MFGSNFESLVIFSPAKTVSMTSFTKFLVKLTKQRKKFLTEFIVVCDVICCVFFTGLPDTSKEYKNSRFLFDSEAVGLSDSRNDFEVENIILLL